jgi:hypothetical protein
MSVEDQNEASQKHKRQKAAESYHKADVAMQEFLDICGDPMFAERPVSHKRFYAKAFFIACLEFGVVFYFMRKQLGDADATYAAALAVVVVVASALMMAKGNALFAINQPKMSRIWGFVLQSVVLFGFVYAVGLLSNFRADGMALGLNVAIEGYQAIFSDIEVFVAALLNYFGAGYLALDARKSFWARFPGYRELRENLDHAEECYDATFTVVTQHSGGDENG